MFKIRKFKVLQRWFQKIIYKLIPQISPEKIRVLNDSLCYEASWNTDYILCTVSACLIATLGLISNSAAVIIGAMLVAPLMLPLRALAYAACEGDFKLFRSAFLSILGATILALFLAGFLGFIITIPELTSEMLARTQPNLLDLGIAITAGGLSGFGKIRTGISDALAGTAIAVALMPPLCVVGLCLTTGYWAFAFGSFLLYLTNLLGIALACMVVFIVSGYTRANRALGVATLLTSLLLIPLGASFIRLITQQRIEAQITEKLIKETETIGRSASNIRINIQWTHEPPIVSIILITDKKITSRQVQLLEQYLLKTIGKPFKVVLFLIPVERVSEKEEHKFDPKKDIFNFDKDSFNLPSN